MARWQALSCIPDIYGAGLQECQMQTGVRCAACPQKPCVWLEQRHERLIAVQWLPSHSEKLGCTAPSPCLISYYNLLQHTGLFAEYTPASGPLHLPFHQMSALYLLLQAVHSYHLSTRFPRPPSLNNPRPTPHAPCPYLFLFSPRSLTKVGYSVYFTSLFVYCLPP